MNPAHVPKLIGTLVVIIGGMGILQMAQNTSFLLPSEHNLQTTLLQEYRSNLDLSKIDTLSLVEAGNVTRKQLHALSVSVLQNWNEGPPEKVTDGAALYAVSDVFGLLASALQYYNQNGTLPPSIEIKHLVTPAQNITVDEAVQVRWEEILKGADQIEVAPKKSIPSTIKLETLTLTASELLHGMAQVFLVLDSGETMPTWIYIVPTKNF